MGTSGPLSAILKFGSRRTSDDVISVTIESGMVENVVVAVGISLISYSVTEIQSTSGVLTAILFSAYHLMSAKMENYSIMLEPGLFDKFSTKTLKYVWKLYRLTDIHQLDIISTITALSGFQPPFCFISSYSGHFRMWPIVSSIQATMKTYGRHWNSTQMLSTTSDITRLARFCKFSSCTSRFRPPYWKNGKRYFGNFFTVL